MSKEKLGKFLQDLSRALTGPRVAVHSFSSSFRYIFVFPLFKYHAWFLRTRSDCASRSARSASERIVFVLVGVGMV
jgi:hypothetical protein